MTTSNASANLRLAALIPSLVTIGVFTPYVMGLWDENPVWGWFMLTAPPIAAFIVNVWRPAATNAARALLVALPQVVLLPLMTWLHVWLDVRRGVLLPNSSEEAMAYGIGITVSLIVGAIMVWVVAGAGWLGTRLSNE